MFTRTELAAAKFQVYDCVLNGVSPLEMLSLDER